MISKNLRTPTDLILELAERVKEATKDLRFPESNGKHEVRAPRVWTQHLPEKLGEGMSDPADFPFVLVALGGGNAPEQSLATCTVAIWCAAWDDGLYLDMEGNPIPCKRDEDGNIVALDGSTGLVVRDKQGWLYVSEMVWRIVVEIAKNPYIGPFVLEYPLSFDIPVEAAPDEHWHGVINLTWTIPIPTQLIDLENQNFYNPQPLVGQTEAIDTLERT